ncbi:hypothetical protein HK097_001222 [Rhizophlyctis rosea]|uniref:NAA35-like TPR repeats domain-containing protein n=1 Tax=Rhizophlyctis rosea TaxID=64517 RepID=A0AAD5S6E0_9FUNG|nr:hypothetical protein HK097_001222 [Rhizophlyctis rosea]
MIVHENKLMGRTPFEDTIRQSVNELCHPPFLESTNSVIRDTLKKFFEISVEPVSHMLQNHGYNRARQRRRLERLTVEWEALQMEVEMMDTQIQQHERAEKQRRQGHEPFFLSSWVYNEKLNLLITYLSLGFELDLYSPAEHLMGFWYLKHLFETKLEHLMRIDEVREERAQSIGTKAKSKPLLPPPAEQWASANAKHSILYAQQLIYTALFQIALALRKSNLVTPPDNGLYDEKVHYEQRLRVFMQLGSPVVLSFEMFQETIGYEEDTVPELLNAAQECLKGAKQKLDYLWQASGGQAGKDGGGVDENYRKELQSLMRVCLGNTVAIKSSGLVGGKVDGMGKSGVWCFKLSYHPRIPILSNSSE